MSGADERTGQGSGTRYRLPVPPLNAGWHAYGVVLTVLWAAWAVTGFLVLGTGDGSTALGRYGLVGLALVAPTLVLALYRLRYAVEHLVEVDEAGLTLTVEGRWWRRERSWSVAWERVQYVSAWSLTYYEKRPQAKGHQHVQRPVLDLYLYFGPGEVPRWVGARDSEGRTSIPVEPPAARVRLGGPGPVSAQVITSLTRAVGKLRPDLFYRGISTAQHYVAPETEETAGPVRHRSPIPVPEAPRHRVWMDLRLSPLRWSGTLAALTALLGLCLLGVSSELWYPLVGGVSALPLLLLLPALAYWLYLAPGVTAERGIGVGPEGLWFRQRRLLWARTGLDETIPWSEVRAIVARTVPAQEVVTLNHRIPLRAPGVRDDQGRVVEIYVRPRYGDARRWRALGINAAQLSRGDSRGIDDLVDFPATRLRLHHHPEKEAAGAPVWRGFLNGGTAPEEVGHWQLRQVLHAFRPDLCHGFDDLPDPFRGRE